MELDRSGIVCANQIFLSPKMELNRSQIVSVNDIVRSIEQLNSSIGLVDLQQVSYHGHPDHLGHHGHHDHHGNHKHNDQGSYLFLLCHLICCTPGFYIMIYLANWQNWHKKAHQRHAAYQSSLIWLSHDCPETCQEAIQYLETKTWEVEKTFARS